MEKREPEREREKEKKTVFAKTTLFTVKRSCLLTLTLIRWQFGVCIKGSEEFPFNLGVDLISKQALGPPRD